MSVPEPGPAALRPAIVIPFYNHERAIGRTVAGLRRYGLPCWIVDDGSEPRCAPVLRQLAEQERGWLRLLRLSPNQGKGLAVMTGMRAAAAAGCSHAVQIDADGQHDPAGLERLLQAARQHPAAVICGVPVYDASVPKGRLYGRYITHVWVWINTLSLEIRDSMCGFRVYPLAPALRVWDTQPVGRRMQFDTDILVRLFWQGLRVINVPVRVTYPPDGVSHFDLWRDNLRISGMHARLFFGMLRRLPRLVAQRLRGRR
ncbi:MAG TPA: glycosyltransferase family 2 protein [Nevskia sp.]|nr:glycosyltransferase family 2 protein [Nevskia sp.]